MIAIMNLNMSYQLKLEILNAVRKRNRMFAIWIDLCGTISFLILLTISLINATELRELIFGDDEHLPYIITILSIVLSVSFDFVFKADRYKKNVELIDKIIKHSSMRCKFNKYFIKAIPLITEMDVARARFDYCKKLKVHKKLHLQIEEDKLQPVDILTMNRQLYIIIVLILEIVLFITLLVFLALDRIIAIPILIMMVLIGIISMIIDSGGMKRAEKKIRKIYEKEVTKECKKRKRLQLL